MRDLNSTINHLYYLKREAENKRDYWNADRLRGRIRQLNKIRKWMIQTEGTEEYSPGVEIHTLQNT